MARIHARLQRKVYDFDPGSNIVDVCVRRLREKLAPDVIETVRGIGYRLRA
jgi:DNA-binding response OmpR family regulator